MSQFPFLFYCSEVAACVGENKYKKRWEAFRGLFQRINQGMDYQRLIDRMSKMGRTIISDEEKIQHVISSSGLNETVQKFLATPVETSDELTQTIESFATVLEDQETKYKNTKKQLKCHLATQTQNRSQYEAKLEKLQKEKQALEQTRIALECSVSNQDSEILQNLNTKTKMIDQSLVEVRRNVDTVSRDISQLIMQSTDHEQQWSDFKQTKQLIIKEKQTTFGKVKEYKLLESNILGLVTNNNSQLYKKQLGVLPFPWGIGGKIDGFRDGELIEIKNRKSHLYDPLPQYDVIQVQCYMQILDVNRATLIQCLATDQDAYQTRETVIHRDEDYWNKQLLPELNVMVRALSKFCNDTLLQDKFFETPDAKKTYVLNSLLTQVRKEMSSETGELKQKRTKKRVISSTKTPDIKKKTKTTVIDYGSSTVTPTTTTPTTATPTTTTVTPTTTTATATVTTATPNPIIDALIDFDPTLEFVQTSVPSSSPSPSPSPSPQVPTRICFFDSPEDAKSKQQSPVEQQNATPLSSLIPLDWATHLQPDIQNESFIKLEAFLDQDYKTFIVYPPRSLIFSALQKCSWDKTRVVILGQDPYINTGEAMGLSFSVPKGVKFPKSLKNIFEELQRDTNVPPPVTGDLSFWAEQGVLLLNTVLTVRSGKSDSHAGQGWEQFTDALIQNLSQSKFHLVFLLWGAKAQSKRHLIDKTKHTLLETSHPSPLSYQRGFVGCKHFTKTNEALISHGQTPIDWQLKQF